MKKHFTCALCAGTILLSAGYVQGEQTFSENSNSNKAWQELSLIFDHPSDSKYDEFFKSFYNNKDYEKRIEIVDNMIYRWAKAENIAPDSRKPTSLKENPMDARQLVAVEYAVGTPYHNKHWEHDEPQNPRPVAASYLIQAYEDIRDYCYYRLRLSEFSEPLKQINVRYTFVSGEKPVFLHQVNTEQTAAMLEAEWLKKDFTSRTIDMQDLEKIIKRTRPILFEGFQKYAKEHPQSPFKEYFANMGNNKPVLTLKDDTVYGTKQDDYINAFAGNDRIFALDGNDYIIGGSNNDYLNGGEGDDTYYFASNWGKDEIDNCQSNKNDKDIILFEKGISSQDISAYRVGKDYKLVHKNQKDSIVIKNYFSKHKNCQISKVSFIDGDTWEKDDLNEKYSYALYVYESLKEKVSRVWDYLGSFFEDVMYKIIVKINS